MKLVNPSNIAEWQYLHIMEKHAVQYEGQHFL